MKHLPTKVLLATDGSEDAALAARVAADLNSRTGAELHIVHAWQFTPPNVTYPGLGPGGFKQMYEQRARELLDKEVERVVADGGSVARARLVAGSPVDAILDVADETGAGLVVMGSRGLGAVERILTGSVSEGVVRHSEVPVLVVRDSAWPPARIVVGDDGSDDARRAAQLAAEMGSLWGAGGVLVRAYHNPPKPPGGWTAEQAGSLDEARMKIEDLLAERAREIEKILGSAPEIRVVEGDAASAILDAAEGGPALIAVGSRGLGPIKRIRPGSVSTKVLRAAKCPVLVCPHQK